ncbi:MAG: hypothetical protein RLY86_3498 [Pseudomonadota bacterium]|jgi:hypothetical protein
MMAMQKAAQSTSFHTMEKSFTGLPPLPCYFSDKTANFQNLMISSLSLPIG